MATKKKKKIVRVVNDIKQVVTVYNWFVFITAI